MPRASAAPTALFALGVALSGLRLARPSLGVVALTSPSLITMPALVFLILGLSNDGWMARSVFAAAVPCGMLAYSSVLLRGISHDDVSLAILRSSIPRLPLLGFVA